MNAAEKKAHLKDLAEKIKEAYKFGALHYARVLEHEYCELIKPDHTRD